MSTIVSLASEHLEARIVSQLEKGQLKAIEGRLQRVNYVTKELAVVSEGQIQYFRVDGDSQLWFDDQKTILRCYHPLDQVKVIYQDGEPKLVKALYSREKQVLYCMKDPFYRLPNRSPPRGRTRRPASFYLECNIFNATCRAGHAKQRESPGRHSVPSVRRRPLGGCEFCPGSCPPAGSVRSTLVAA